MVFSPVVVPKACYIQGRLPSRTHLAHLISTTVGLSLPEAKGDHAAPHRVENQVSVGSSDGNGMGLDEFPTLDPQDATICAVHKGAHSCTVISGPAVLLACQQ